MTREARFIPLLRDHHTHPYLYAALQDGIDLYREIADEPGPEDDLRDRAVRTIRERAAGGPDGWTIAHGWNSGLYRLTREDVDDLSGPVAVFNLSLHGMIVNAAGRALLEREVPAIAAHLDDPEWIERNLRAVLNVFASAGASVERLQRHFRRLLEECGVYHAEEMLLVHPDEIRIFEEAGLSERTRFWAAPDQYAQLPGDVRKKIHGIKLFTDGALGTWTAALHRPYRDRGGTGLLLYPEPGHLESVLQPLLDRRLPIALHAIGDRAIDRVVSALEAVRWPESGEIRIEHAQFIGEDAARRARDMGVVLCMQPNFSGDSVHYAERLPDGAPARNNPFRMLIDRAGYTPGVDLLFGSDGMPHGFRHALEESLFPKGGHPDQVLTLDEFVAGYGLPDTGAGAIRIRIDRTARTVTGRVVLPER